MENYLQKEIIRLVGLDIYCEYLINEKPPILLIHGFVSSTYTFKNLIPLLSKDFSVIALDLPGFGKSEKSKTFVYTFENYSKVITACIEHFRLNNVTIVGHSMGGQVALYAAKHQPEKINKLVLLCSSGYLKPARKPLVYFTYLPFSRYMMEKYIRRRDWRKAVENILFDHQHITEELMEEFTRPFQDKHFYTSLVRLLRYREGDLSSSQLKTIQTPTLLIWGREDKVVPVSIGQKLADDLPYSRLITYERTGHLVTKERTHDVYNEIIAYAK
ncbi:alpha/beta hydrolase [Aquibacillus kalidii]|uniref:alpha/beta hydrolase n=1 Tax=Aquibacillus kalidii TaxID=2762597 RepID=UPI001647CDDE|nr:alpha/beta hydrolase [Aquibacillus kalidii]